MTDKLYIYIIKYASNEQDLSRMLELLFIKAHVLRLEIKFKKVYFCSRENKIFWY